MDTLNLVVLLLLVLYVLWDAVYYFWVRCPEGGVDAHRFENFYLRFRGEDEESGHRLRKPILAFCALVVWKVALITVSLFVTMAGPPGGLEIEMQYAAWAGLPLTIWLVLCGWIYRSGVGLFVQRGVYMRIRYPEYVADLFFWIAIAILLREYWFIGVLLVFLVSLYRICMVLDTIKISILGNEYRKYMLRTGRWFPRFGLL